MTSIKDIFSEILNLSEENARKGFECFHFRHRPEVRRPKTNEEDSETKVIRDDKNRVKSTCCVIKVYNKHVQKFLKMYNKKHWVDKEGNTMFSRCFISRIKVEEGAEKPKKTYTRRGDVGEIEADRESFTCQDLNSLIELHPPALMPNGNVGTPTKHFLALINSCRLPPYLITKLGLVFPKTKSSSIYGSVPFDYGTGHAIAEDSNDEIDVRTAKGHALSNTYIEPIKVDKKFVEYVPCDSDDDTGEEWDRHESLHNDVTSQERTKERLFEEEIELKWEKGGSGLVFYTDAQFWDEKDGDFDEKTTDDWDVDMSIYYEPGGGDKDSKDLMAMRRENKLRCGEDIDINAIGNFERHTKGFGRKLMESQGWKDGQGLGSTIKGMTDALPGDGKHPFDKKGLGYYGEKINRHAKRKQKRNDDNVVISTVYDEAIKIDQAEPLYRSHPPTSVKRRYKSSM